MGYRVNAELQTSELIERVLRQSAIIGDLLIQNEELRDRLRVLEGDAGSDPFEGDLALAVAHAGKRDGVAR